MAPREYTEAPIRQGRLESPWTGLIGGVVLGGKEYARQLLEEFKAESLDEAAQAVRRFAAGLAQDAAKVRFVEGMKRSLRERTQREPQQGPLVG